MKYAPLLLLFLPLFALADTGSGLSISDFFEWIANLGNDIWNLMTVDTPNMIHRMWAFIIEWYLLLQFYWLKELLEFSWLVAKAILQDLNVVSQIIALSNSLPPDLKQTLIDLRVFDAVALILDAIIARFILDAAGF